MKIGVGILGSLLLLGLGYLLGKTDGPEPTTGITSRTELRSYGKSSAGQDENFENVDYEKMQNAPKEKRAKTKLERNQKMQKHFQYLLDRLPFAYVSKYYDKRNREVTKAAFEIFAKPDSKDFEAVKAYQQESFDILKPKIDSGPYYKAEGTLRYKGFDIPYVFSISFKNPWRLNKSGKLEKPEDLDFMISMVFDTRSSGIGAERFVVNSGSGIYDVIQHRGKTYLKSYVYYGQKSTIFDNALYFLIEAPAGRDISTELQLFDTSLNKWEVLTDQVNFKAVSKEVYQKAKNAAFIVADDVP